MLRFSCFSFLKKLILGIQDSWSENKLRTVSYTTTSLYAKLELIWSNVSFKSKQSLGIVFAKTLQFVFRKITKVSWHK